MFGTLGPNVMPAFIRNLMASWSVLSSDAVSGNEKICIFVVIYLCLLVFMSLNELSNIPSKIK